MIETIRQGLKEDGLDVSVSKLCRWLGVPRRTVYYRPTKKVPIVQERFAQPIKQRIEEHPAFGYRTVAHLLGFNKNTVQRVFQLAVAGAQTTRGLQAAGAGAAFGSGGPERAMGDGSVPRLDWQRWLGRCWHW